MVSLILANQKEDAMPFYNQDDSELEGLTPQERIQMKLTGKLPGQQWREKDLPPFKAVSSGVPGGLMLLLFLVVAGFGAWYLMKLNQAQLAAEDDDVAYVSPVQIQTVDDPASTSHSSRDGPTDRSVQPSDEEVGDANISLRPCDSNGCVQWYLDEEADVEVMVDGITEFALQWGTKPELPQLHLIETSSLSIRLYADGVIYAAATEPGLDGSNAIWAELYDGRGKLLRTEYWHVQTNDPLLVELPLQASTSPDPFAPTEITPRVEWKEEAVFGPGDGLPSGMQVEWYFNDQFTSSGGTYVIEPNDFSSGTLRVEVSYHGFTDRAEMAIN